MYKNQAFQGYLDAVPSILLPLLRNKHSKHEMMKVYSSPPRVYTAYVQPVHASQAAASFIS